MLEFFHINPRFDEKSSKSNWTWNAMIRWTSFLIRHVETLLVVIQLLIHGKLTKAPRQHNPSVTFCNVSMVGYIVRFVELRPLPFTCPSRCDNAKCQKSASACRTLWECTGTQVITSDSGPSICTPPCHNTEVEMHRPCFFTLPLHQKIFPGQTSWSNVVMIMRSSCGRHRLTLSEVFQARSWTWLKEEQKKKWRRQSNAVSDSCTQLQGSSAGACGRMWSTSSHTSINFGFPRSPRPSRDVLQLFETWDKLRLYY